MVSEEFTRLSKLYELSMTLSGEPMDIFVYIARLIGEWLNVKVVCLSEIRGHELHFLSVYVRGKVLTHAGSCPLAITPCATVEANRELRIYDRVTERFPEAAFLQEHHAFTYCGFPSLDSDDNVIAVTCLLDDQPHEFTVEDQQWLLILGQRIGLELQRKQLADAHQASLRALAASEERLGLALMGADLGLWDWNIVTGTVHYSERWASMLGYSAQEMKPDYSGWERLVHPEDLPRVLKNLDAHLAGAAPFYEVEHRLLTKAGDWLWVLARGKVLERDPSGKPLRASGTHMDITHQKRLETRLRDKREKLYHAQRLTLAGELAATMAHELNQPLASIANYLGAATIGYAALLEQQPGLQEIINEARQVASHAAAVIKNFRRLARSESGQQEWVNLREILDEIFFLLHRELEQQNIHRTIETPPGLPSLRSRRLHLQQMLLNLILNAKDAMSSAQTLDQRRLKVAIRLSQGPCIIITVADSGPGIAPAIAQQLFKPFFTTKPDGIGLGLSICRTIAENHGGKIRARSSPAMGTVFRVTLPVGPHPYPHA